jgi:hypothetical protein
VTWVPHTKGCAIAMHAMHQTPSYEAAMARVVTKEESNTSPSGVPTSVLGIIL